MPRIRMCDEDRATYGGPEWVEIDMSALLDESTGLLEQIEENFGLTPGEFLVQTSRGGMRATRAMVWTARFKAGCKDDPRTFRPRVQEFSGVQYEPTSAELEAAVKAARREAEADPPANRADRRAGAKAAKGKAAKAGKAAARTGTGASAT